MQWELASDITVKAKLRELPCLPDVLGLSRGSSGSCVLLTNPAEFQSWDLGRSPPYDSKLSHLLVL